MNSFIVLVFSVWLGCLSAFSFVERGQTGSSNPTLKLVHVLFRHGNRNPDNGTIIKGSPYYAETFYPEGYGQLTNAGKLTEYKIGKALRKRYNNFLTDTWNINYIDARSTDVNRTKMSIELVLASLYSPKNNQMWSNLNWQPIPYNYYPTTQDKEIQSWTACSNWNTVFSNILSSPEIENYLLRYKKMFAIMSNKTGENIGVYEAFSYYFGFATQRELGYKLEEWTKPIYPEPIHSAAVDVYYLITKTTEIRRIMPGYLLKQILTDTKAKIDGTISPSTRKMFLYSAHEMNVASMIVALDAFKVNDIPPYGSYVLFEVHKINRVWGIKLFYQNYKQTDPIPIKLPACDYFCPYDQFYTLVEEILPTDETECYGT